MAGVWNSSRGGVGAGLDLHHGAQEKALGGLNRSGLKSHCWAYGRLDGSRDTREVSGQGGELSQSRVSGQGQWVQEVGRPLGFWPGASGAPGGGLAGAVVSGGQGWGPHRLAGLW